MATTRDSISVYSDGRYYTEILTDKVRKKISRGEIRSGFVHLLVQHTTSALMLVEHEAGIVMDIKRLLQEFIPDSDAFFHHRRGVDENGAGHVLSALFNRTLVMPFIDGDMTLGTYQEIMFMDFQPEPLERFVALTIVGDCPR